VYELIPIFAGVANGLAAMALEGTRGRAAAIAAVALVAGITAATLSGEVVESWAFALWDTAQALAAGALTVLGATALGRRRTSG
jgi:hypothetical protein